MATSYRTRLAGDADAFLRIAGSRPGERMMMMDATRKGLRAEEVMAMFGVCRMTASYWAHVKCPILGTIITTWTETTLNKRGRPDAVMYWDRDECLKAKAALFDSSTHVLVQSAARAWKIDDQTVLTWREDALSPLDHGVELIKVFAKDSGGRWFPQLAMTLADHNAIAKLLAPIDAIPGDEMSIHKAAARIGWKATNALRKRPRKFNGRRKILWTVRAADVECVALGESSSEDAATWPVDSPDGWARRFKCSWKTLRRRIDGGVIEAAMVHAKLWRIRPSDVPS